MYKAIVTRISVEPIEGFDNLNQGFCGNYKVLVDKSVKTGELGVYFPTDGQLTLGFCQKNNLLRKNPDGSPGGGYFELNMRVKAIKLKKVKSEGFWCPLSYFTYTGYNLNSLEEGFQFDELNGHKICNKYYTPATLRQMNANKNQGKKTIRIKKEFLFPEHYDTNQFKHNVHAILPGSLVYVSSKIHGCVSKDTLIDTLEFGPLRIDKIVNEKLDCHIKAFDTTENEVVFVPISDYYFLENDGEWYEIELEDGRKITITGNNPVWLPELKCYRKTENLTIGDVLLID